MPRRRITADPQFGARLRELRTAAGMSTRDFKTVSRAYVSQLERGRPPTPEIAAALDRELGTTELSAMVHSEDAPTPPPPAEVDDELDAIELGRRVSASDVGEETILRIEAAVDDLAIRYSLTPPAYLLGRVRRHLGYVGNLLDPGTRKTLTEHRRLLVAGAWLSLLGATLHIDLRQMSAARARLVTAASMANQAGHREIHAWCYETEAWSVLTDGDYRRALELAQTAAEIAPAGSSAQIQATAQQGRAWARMGAQKETRGVLREVEAMVANLPRPARPEHHYRYDPAKANAYVATTLAWVGDPAAERYARDVITGLRSAEEAGGWPRRVAAAQLDLGLALVAAGKHDEAAASAKAAIGSGRIVPSNHWRALEVVRAVEDRQLPEAKDLREAYEALRAGQVALPSAD